MTIVFSKCIMKTEFELLKMEYANYYLAMGGVMEELEFSRELVKISDKSILEKALKKAGSQGFTVQGFDKNVWKAPAAKVNSSLEKRKRGGKYQCRILLECLAGLQEEHIEIELARKWLENDEERAEAEKKLLEIVLYKKAEKNIETTEMKEVISNDSDGKHEKNEKNIEIMSQQKKRIDKLQKTLQDLRIVADNYKKEMETLHKERKKLTQKYEEEQKKNERFLENIEELKMQIGDYQQQLSQKNELINYYKRKFEKVPHVACFSKKRIDIEIFPLHNIEQIKEWKNDFENEIEWKSYQEIWIVESDFSYPEVINIKRMANGKVVCARNLKSLIEKVGGIK